MTGLPIRIRWSISSVFSTAFRKPTIESLVALNSNASHPFVPFVLPELENGLVKSDHTQQQLSVNCLQEVAMHSCAVPFPSVSQRMEV